MPHLLLSQGWTIDSKVWCMLQIFTDVRRLLVVLHPAWHLWFQLVLLAIWQARHRAVSRTEARWYLAMCLRWSVRAPAAGFFCKEIIYVFNLFIYYMNHHQPRLINRNVFPNLLPNPLLVGTSVACRCL